MKGRYISFLDLMCCGFGGALLMFLIVASAQSKSEPSQPMLLIRCRVADDIDRRAVGAQLGLQYRQVGSDEWIRPAHAAPGSLALPGKSDVFYFFPPAVSGAGADALFICNHPNPGRWQVRAYIASTLLLEARDPEDRSAVVTEQIAVELDVIGAAELKSLRATLQGVGDFTQPLEFEVKAVHSP